MSAVGITNVNLVRLKMIINDLPDQQKRVSLEVDEMACKSLLLWIPSRQHFVVKVDFGDVSMNEEYNHVNNEECEDETDDEQDEPEETIGNGRVKSIATKTFSWRDRSDHWFGPGR